MPVLEKSQKATLEIDYSHLLKRAKSETVWDLGNKVLYDLCQNNFKHEKDEEIIAKVWLIGRSYAAAIERGRNLKENPLPNDEFYKAEVTTAFKKLNLDNKLKSLSRISPTIETIPDILRVHNEVSTININNINSKSLRSFASKYLHFHLPELFFIYDSRACTNIKKFINKLPKDYKNYLNSGTLDIEYGEFYYKCFMLQQQIKENTGEWITPRKLDNILLETV